MFNDEGAILRAAAALAAAQHELNTSAVHNNARPRPYTNSPVDVLVNLLREMEQKKLVPPGLVPPPRRR